MTSLRKRLVLQIGIGVGLVLIAFGALLYHLVRGSLVRQLDASLYGTHSALQNGVSFDDDGLEVNLPHGDKLFDESRDFLYLLAGPDAAPLAGRGDLPPIGFRDDGASADPRYGTLKSGLRVRYIAARFQPSVETKLVLTDKGLQPGTRPVPPTCLLIVARSTGPLDEQIRGFRVMLFATGAATLLLTVLLVWQGVYEGLRPLDAFGDRIASIDLEGSSSRLQSNSLPAELKPVAHTINGLMERLERFVSRQRGFTADVAHELRTPLAGMRTTLDVALQRTREPAEYAEAMTDLRDISDRMQTTVERLLMLARLDAGRVTQNAESIPPAELVDACWDAFADAAAERGIEFENRVPRNALCRADPDSLTMALANLLENAATYAGEGGEISVEAPPQDARIALRISNTGCTLSPEDAEHVFERFWRGDAARTDAGLRCGLGLSLVERLAHAMDGEARVDVKDGRFIVTLTLPT